MMHHDTCNRSDVRSLARCCIAGLMHGHAIYLLQLLLAGSMHSSASLLTLVLSLEMMIVVDSWWMNKRTSLSVTYSSGGRGSNSPLCSSSSSSSSISTSPSNKQSTSTQQQQHASSSGILLSTTLLLFLLFYCTKIYVDVVDSSASTSSQVTSLSGANAHQRIAMLTIYASPPPPSPTTTTDTTTSGMGSSGSIKDVDEKTPGTVYGYEKAKLLQKICLENKRMYAELHGLHLIVGTPSSLVEAFAPRLLKIRWILQLLHRQGCWKWALLLEVEKGLYLWVGVETFQCFLPLQFYSHLL